MKILCITHADFETPGVIETWAHQRGYDFSVVRPYAGESLAQHQNFDFLILMGGPQSPLEIEKDPYLRDEILLAQQAIQDDKWVLGFCLGAQLIGEALGGRPFFDFRRVLGQSAYVPRTVIFSICRGH